MQAAAQRNAKDWLNSDRPGSGPEMLAENRGCSLSPNGAEILSDPVSTRLRLKPYHKNAVLRRPSRSAAVRPGCRRLRSVSKFRRFSVRSCVSLMWPAQLSKKRLFIFGHQEDTPSRNHHTQQQQQQLIQKNNIKTRRITSFGKKWKNSHLED